MKRMENSLPGGKVKVRGFLHPAGSQQESKVRQGQELKTDDCPSAVGAVWGEGD